ncbi:head-tail connector protein [Kiloniella antarctica]|uniref:PhiE125 gp8 family phage protein n=1 Tax=Kiloniella antarctica TaxID=1550907 RepID=A0ABW5BKE6_9PROT
MPLTITTQAAEKPVSLDEAKRQLSMEDTTDADVLIASHIAAATSHAETILGRALVARTYTATLDCWLDCIWLQMPPLGVVNSVKYDDVDGAEQTLATSVYEVGERFGQAFVKLAPNQSWPDLDNTKSLDRIRIEYTAGYGDADAVPDDIKHAILLLIKYYFDEVDSKIIDTAESMLNPYRVWELA